MCQKKAKETRHTPSETLISVFCHFEAHLKTAFIKFITCSCFSFGSISVALLVYINQLSFEFKKTFTAKFSNNSDIVRYRRL